MPKVIGLKHTYIGKTIRKWLIDADMNQQDLAKAVNMSPQLLGYKIKNNAFDYKDLLDIFAALGLPDEEILKVMKK